MTKPIFGMFAPNNTKKDTQILLSYLFLPWKWFQWKKGPYLTKLKTLIRAHFEGHEPILFDSGRTALQMSLNAIGIKKGDEVIIQGYTCVVVPNAVMALDAKPIYVDIDPATLNIDPNLIEQSISKKTKAIIVQHTFGIPADMDKIVAIAKKHNLYIIEDCAHTIGGKYKKKLLGTFGDISIFSFGSEKAITSVRGGMALTKNPKLQKSLTILKDSLKYPSFLTIKRRMLHPLVFAAFLPSYCIGNIGKALLLLSRKLGLFEPFVTKNERLSIPNAYTPTKFPHVLAHLAYEQFKELQKRNNHRATLTKIYAEALSDTGYDIQSGAADEEVFPLRTVVFHKHAEEIITTMKQKRILVPTDWLAPIAPPGTSFKQVHYDVSFCPNAERVAKEMIHLPTYPRISKAEAKRIAKVIN